MASLPLFDRLEEEAADTPLWSVSQLTALVRQTIETGFADIGVRGEISNLARPRSGHVYFRLKDEGAQVRAVLWRRDAERLVFDLEDGLAVRAWGDLTVYPPRGEYQLSVRQIEPEGIGVLELAFRQVVQRLAAEGLFDPARKRPLPPYPTRIAVVTSPTGAAVRDFLQVVGRRWPSAEILIVPTLVQGPGAAESIAAALATADRIEPLDLVVLARGGGSLEDLWAFNEEAVARAIFAARRPVVSAIGHEIDVTVADLVADVRALTPTDAGGLCVPDAREVRLALDRLRDRLARAVAGPIDDARDTLDRLADRARRALTLDLERKRQSLARLAAGLDALSPLGVLARGYSLTFRDDDGRLVRDAAELRPGDRLRTRLAAGTVISRVDELAPEPPRSPR